MTPESKIFGMGVRSFCSAFIVVVSTLVLAYQSITTGDATNLMILVTGALGYLYGKASGVEESKKPTP